MSICSLTQVLAKVNFSKVKDSLILDILSEKMTHSISKNIKFIQIRPSYQKL